MVRVIRVVISFIGVLFFLIGTILFIGISPIRASIWDFLLRTIVSRVFEGYPELGRKLLVHVHRVRLGHADWVRNVSPAERELVGNHGAATTTTLSRRSLRGLVRKSLKLHILGSDVGLGNWDV
jgi:hypothetical protein